MAKRIHINSIIGEGSSFEGDFYVAGSVQIDGKFEGNIKTDDHLVIGASGKVKTQINSSQVTVSGTLIGDIVAESEVVLLETGRVLGDITAAKIDVNEGAVFQGKLNITGGQRKDVTEIINESYNGTAAKLGEK